MTTLTNSSAIVFAGSRGIGRATALRLAKEGASVLLTYVSNQEAANEVVSKIKALGGNAAAIKVEVANNDEVVAAFDEATQLFGKVDIVINAAAVSIFGPLESLDHEAYSRAFDVNAKGAFNVLGQASARTSDNGRVIQFSTGGTKMSMAGTGLYAAAKAAGEHMALSLSKELGSRNITVNVVSPGVTDTDGLVMPEEQIQGLIGQTPLGRLGQPEDIADVVVFLASKDARWVTGQNIQINGGIL
jgi:3-oxoacyl-[acyl-carrier protein] reductase